MDKTIKNSVNTLFAFTCILVSKVASADWLTAIIMGGFCYIFASTYLHDIYSITDCTPFEIMFPQLLAFIMAIFYVSTEREMFLIMVVSFILSPFFFDYIKKMLSIKPEKNSNSKGDLWNTNIINTIIQTLIGVVIGLLATYLLTGHF